MGHVNRAGVKSLVLMTLVISGCGSSGPQTTKTDTEFIRSFVLAAADVTQLAGPVFACDPAACDPVAVGRLRDRAELSSANLEPRIERLSSPCLKSSARLLVRSIRAYASYAAATQQKNTQASIAAADDADNSRLRAYKKLAACGYLKPGQSVGLEVQDSFQRVNRASVGIENCRAKPCFVRKGRQIERAAAAGINQIQSAAARVDDQCLRTLVQGTADIMRRFQQFGRAAEELDGARMQTLGKQIGQLQAQNARRAKQCLPTG